MPNGNPSLPNWARPSSDDVNPVGVQAQCSHHAGLPTWVPILLTNEISMKNIEHRDLAAGALLCACGLFVALYASSNYTIGDAGSMGPGYFPMVLGWVLAGLGVIIALLAFRKTVQVLHPPAFRLRPILAILASILVFSLLVERLGLVPATVALTAVAVFAERPFRLKRSLLLAAGLSLISWLIFTVALSMSLPAFNFGG